MSFMLNVVLLNINTGRAMIRESPANYHDGIRVPQSEGLPNPYTLSTILKGASGIPSPNQRSVFFTFFGKAVYLS